MAYQLEHLAADHGSQSDAEESMRWITSAELRQRVHRLLMLEAPRYRRLWAYYRNPARVCPSDPAADAGSDRPYRQAQEWGLPSRITAQRSGGEIFDGQPVTGVARKEIVIENDIGWRIDTQVDYLFGKPIVINSAAPDPRRRALIERLLRQILALHGGIVFLQQLAQLGSVYGFVDVLVKFDTEGMEREQEQSSSSASRLSSPESEVGAPGESSACGMQELGEPPAQQHPHPQERRERSIDSSPDGRPPSDGNGVAQDGARSRPPTEAAGPATGPAEFDDPSTAPGASHPSPEANHDGADAMFVSRLARRVRLEIVEPARALPLLSPWDYRCVQAYAQVYDLPRSACPARPAQMARTARHAASARARRMHSNDNSQPTLLDRLRSTVTTLLPRLSLDGNGEPLAPHRALLGSDRVLVTEILTAGRWQRYENERLVDEGENSLGVLPLVHVQNTPLPFEYCGGSDVEPLMGVQDELNTRLSDRAYRITLQSFKMYLGKGIENFTEMPVAPGRMWVTDNEQAEIIEFGGDGKTFSEDNHIIGLRDAMDKISGVTPIAAGAIKGRIGRLTSAAALRVTMLALLARIERKRTTYGRAIEQICELSLAWLDKSGLFPTRPEERRIEIHWPSPIPVNELERLQEAQAKVQVGVPREVVLRELGY